MRQKGVKVLFEHDVREKLEGSYLDFAVAEFTLFVGRVTNVGCWCSRRFIGLKRYCKVVEPGVTVPRAAIVLVLISLGQPF
jgi:hypothetical protein